MKGKYIGSLEGREADIEYDKLTHSYREEEYGKHIAQLILQSNRGEEDYIEEFNNPIWMDGQYALTYDRSEGIFDLFSINTGISEIRKKQNSVKLNETQLKKIVAESVKRILKEVNYVDYNVEIEEVVENMLDIQRQVYYGAYFDPSGENPEEYTNAMRIIFEGIESILEKIGYEGIN